MEIKEKKSKKNMLNGQVHVIQVGLRFKISVEGCIDSQRNESTIKNKNNKRKRITLFFYSFRCKQKEGRCFTT